MAKALDLTNQKFGRLIALRDVGSRVVGKNNKAHFWSCVCECGNAIEVSAAALRSGNTQSCGCYWKEKITQSNRIDLTGKRYGRLTVLSLTNETKNNELLWDCVCDCGNKIKTLTSYLRSGDTSSCGCLRQETAARTRTTHGMTGSSEHVSWKAMLTRCFNPNISNWMDYGGRGITVCDRWRYSFENFYADMGPSNGLSIERVNNDGNYGPGNCVWANAHTQGLNRRLSKNNTTGVKGVSFKSAIQKYHATLQVDGQLVLNKQYSTLEEAKNARLAAEKTYIHSRHKF